MARGYGASKVTTKTLTKVGICILFDIIMAKTIRNVLFKLFVLSMLWLMSYIFINIAIAQDFDTFFLDIPNGWGIEKDENAYRFIHPQKKCIINILVSSHQDVTFRELVIEFYQNLQGKNAKNDDNGISFDMTIEDDIAGKVRLSFQGDNFAAVSALGQCADYQDVLSSLYIFDANKKPLLNADRPYPLLK